MGGANHECTFDNEGMEGVGERVRDEAWRSLALGNVVRVRRGRQGV